MMRRPRFREPGIEIWRLRAGIDEDLERFGEAGFIEMNRRSDRPDVAKVVGALHLVLRRKEVATVARVASVLDWPFPRVRTALCALEERKVVHRKRIPYPYSPRAAVLGGSDSSRFDESDFTPAGRSDDPRGDERIAPSVERAKGNLRLFDPDEERRGEAA